MWNIGNQRPRTPPSAAVGPTLLLSLVGSAIRSCRRPGYAGQEDHGDTTGRGDIVIAAESPDMGDAGNWHDLPQSDRHAGTRGNRRPSAPGGLMRPVLIFYQIL